MSDTDDITQGIAPQFSGTATDADSGLWKVVIASDDTKSATDTTASFYSVTLPALDEGGRTVTATAYDVAGNAVTTAGLAVTVDRTAPTASVPDLAAAAALGPGRAGFALWRAHELDDAPQYHGQGRGHQLDAPARCGLRLYRLVSSRAGEGTMAVSR